MALSGGEDARGDARPLLAGRVLIEGEAEGEIMRLDPPLSFWGGVDPSTGEITQPRHPGHGRSIAGKVLVMERTIGSSSSSAIMLELIYRGRAPAALLVAEPDAILALGVIVAREMGYGSLPVLQCPLEPLSRHERIRITPDGHLYPGYRGVGDE